MNVTEEFEKKGYEGSVAFVEEDNVVCKNE